MSLTGTKTNMDLVLQGVLALLLLLLELRAKMARTLSVMSESVTRILLTMKQIVTH